MFSVKGSKSKRSRLVYTPSLTTLMKQLNVKTTFIYLTNQLIQVFPHECRGSLCFKR